MSKHKALELADAYAEASFEQGLNRRTLDPEPEKCREKLVAEVELQHALIVQMREACKHLLHEVWSDRHSHMSSEEFDAEFADEKQSIAAADQYLGEKS